MSEFQSLWDKLLDHAGDKVNACYEEDYNKLMNRGVFLTLTLSPAKLPKRFGQSKCHYNAALFYQEKKRKPTATYSIVTGWALFQGEWEQHSWILERKTQTIYEVTPLKRESYFGYILTPDEAEMFLFDNL